MRGSYAAPQKSHLGVGGNTSCVEIRSGEHLLICDGGTGIIPLGEHLVKEDELSEMLVVFTHYHWDHICGLPFFQPAFSPNWKIKLFGPGETADDIENRLSNQMKAPYFPVETETWMADIKYLNPAINGVQHGPINVRFHNVHHPGVTYGYRITVGDKKIVYVSDNEIDFLKSSIEHRYDEFDEEEHQLLQRIENEERTAELDAIRDCDILIHDAQYTPHDYAKKRGWGIRATLTPLILLSMPMLSRCISIIMIQLMMMKKLMRSIAIACRSLANENPLWNVTSPAKAKQSNYRGPFAALVRQD